MTEPSSVFSPASTFFSTLASNPAPILPCPSPSPENPVGPHVSHVSTLIHQSPAPVSVLYHPHTYMFPTNLLCRGDGNPHLSIGSSVSFALTDSSLCVPGLLE